jgi:phosphoglycerol transferase
MSILASTVLTAVAILSLRQTTSASAVLLLLALAIFLNLFLLGAYYQIDAFTGTGIDQSVLYFLVTGLEGAPMSEIQPHVLPALFLTLAAIAAAVLAYQTSRARSDQAPKRSRVWAGVGVLGLAFGVNPALPQIATLANRVAVAKPSGGIVIPAEFVAVDGAHFDKPQRSFVYLYLESYERTFLDETLFPGLAPNLAELQKSALNFTDISQIPGTGYTIAGQIASQCGIPLTAAGTGSDLYLPGAVCLGDLLASQGYALIYMDGAPSSFAGTETYYRTHAFQTVEGIDTLIDELPDADRVSFWGLYDDDLLELAKDRLSAVASGSTPFGFFVQTTDTHHPEGTHIPPSCADHPYLDGSNVYLNSIHCGDRLASDFIRHVLSDPALADVILIVASDHITRPNMASETLAKGQRRNLLMVFGQGVAPGENKRPGNTLDIGPTLLTLIGAPTPALAYGRNLLDPGQTLRELGVSDILDRDHALLQSMWSFPQVSEGIRLETETDRLFMGERFVKLPVLIHLKEDFGIDSIFYLTGTETPPIEYMGSLAFDQPFIFVDKCSRTAIFRKASESYPDKTCALVGRLGSSETGSFLLRDGETIGFETLSKHLQDVPATSEYFDQNIAGWKQGISFVDAAMMEFAPPNGMVGEALIRSGAHPDRFSWVVDPATGTKLNLVRGLTLVGFNEDAPPVKISHKDTCAYGGEEDDPEAGETENFGSDMKANAGKYGALAIITHSSVICYGTEPRLDALFSGTPFRKWAGLTHYQAYVALQDGEGGISELLGEFGISMGLELRNFIRSSRFVQRQVDFLPRVLRIGGTAAAPRAADILEKIKEQSQEYDLFKLGFFHGEDGTVFCGALPEEGDLPNGSDLGGQDSCTLTAIGEWLGWNEGFQLIVDIAAGTPADYAALAAGYPWALKRIVPMFRRPEDYLALRHLGYRDTIWAVTDGQTSPEEILVRLKDMDLMGLVMDQPAADSGLARLAQVGTGVLTWVELADSPAAVDRAVEAGASEVVTDVIMPRTLARVAIVSAGFGAGQSRVSGPGTSIALERGSTLLGLSRDGDPSVLARYDACAEDPSDPAADPAALRDALAWIPADFAALAIVVSDSAFCGDVRLDDLFAESPFPIWPELGFREPYIGLLRPDGRTLQFRGEAETEIRQILTVE